MTREEFDAISDDLTRWMHRMCRTFEAEMIRSLERKLETYQPEDGWFYDEATP